MKVAVVVDRFILKIKSILTGRWPQVTGGPYSEVKLELILAGPD
jgi:hypothetical protein